MKNIEVDFDVWQYIVSRLKDENDTVSDFLRRLFKLPKSKKTTVPQIDFWSSRGGRVRVGTKLRARYKGATHEADVTAKGILYQGDLYADVSNAASEIAKGPRNGWTFFEAQVPGDTNWRPLSAIRIR